MGPASREGAHASDSAGRHVAGKKTWLVSKSNAGEPGDAFTGIPANQRVLSSGGRFVVFDTEATNLPGGGAPANRLVYVRGPLRWPR
ncbi:MAG TPA: hypothetical protein VF058_12295 [Actinomycetota bacterium]